jgi:hypothetical protein
VDSARDFEPSLLPAEDEDMFDSDFDIEDVIFGGDESDGEAKLTGGATPDENGQVRIGPQPIGSHETVVYSAPQYFIDHIFYQFVSNALKPTDAKMLGVGRESMEAVGNVI